MKPLKSIKKPFPASSGSHYESCAKTFFGEQEKLLWGHQRLLFFYTFKHNRTRRGQVVVKIRGISIWFGSSARAAGSFAFSSSDLTAEEGKRIKILHNSAIGSLLSATWDPKTRRRNSHWLISGSTRHGRNPKGECGDFIYSASKWSLKINPEFYSIVCVLLVFHDLSSPFASLAINYCLLALPCSRPANRKVFHLRNLPSIPLQPALSCHSRRLLHEKFAATRLNGEKKVVKSNAARRAY